MKEKKVNELEQKLLNVQEQMKSWNSLVQDVSVPVELAPALMAGRPELVALAKPRAMEKKEVEALYKIIGGLLETNQALQQHSAWVAELAVRSKGHIKGFLGAIDTLESFAKFQTPVNDTDEE